MRGRGVNGEFWFILWGLQGVENEWEISFTGTVSPTHHPGEGRGLAAPKAHL
jgi:hypothetical protein